MAHTVESMEMKITDIKTHMHRISGFPFEFNKIHDWLYEIQPSTDASHRTKFQTIFRESFPDFRNKNSTREIGFIMELLYLLFGRTNSAIPSNESELIQNKNYGTDDEWYKGKIAHLIERLSKFPSSSNGRTYADLTDEPTEKNAQQLVESINMDVDHRQIKRLRTSESPESHAL